MRLLLHRIPPAGENLVRQQGWRLPLAALSSTSPAVQNPNFARRVTEVIEGQTFMGHLGAALTRVAPGEVEITIAREARELRQQHGFFHAGVTTSIADSAAGAAALTLFPAGTDVLTTEFKMNLIRPAVGDRLVARGRVVKYGRTLTVCSADVYGVSGTKEEDTTEVHVATGLLTMVQAPAAPVATSGGGGDD